MRLVNFSKEVIRADKLPFSLNDKIEANIYNAGNVVANIEGIAISPGSSFQAGVQGAITMGGVDIVFEKTAVDTSEDPQPKLVCFFGVLIKENHTATESDCN